MKYPWYDRYLVGIPNIDEQHKKFFDIINRYIANFEALKAGQAAEPQKLLCKEIIDYTLYHFAEEEEYLLKCGCTKCHEHLASHSKYKITLNDYASLLHESESENIELYSQIQKFAEEYLIRHIQGGDETGFLECLKKMG